MLQRRRPAPVPPLRRAAPMIALMTVLVAGCGASSGPSLAASTVAVSGDAATPVPPATAATTLSPTALEPATPRPAAGLPWPAATAAAAADLQRAVDGGSQPWLLDPGEVAESYGAFREWKDVQVSGGPTSVVVRSSAGRHTLTLAQPGRKGQGGIWSVTADSTG